MIISNLTGHRQFPKRLSICRPSLRAAALAGTVATCITLNPANARGQGGAAQALPVQPPAVVPTRRTPGPLADANAQAADAPISPEQATVAAPILPPPPPDAALPDVAPIIDSGEFNRTVPAIAPGNDPALDQPLESIADFERGQAAAAPGTQAEPSSAATPGTPAPAISPAQTALADPELGKPLPPIAGFQVAPAALDAAGGEERATTLRYSVRINGLERADAESDQSLLGQFRAQSALENGNGRALNDAMISARLTEDAALMKRVLAAQGWYASNVQTHIDRAESADGQPLAAVIDVIAGQRYTLATIDLQAPPTVPTTLIADNFAVKTGEPIVAERIQGAEANLGVVLPQYGYAFAKLGDRDILLDPATGTGDYTLPIDTGPRVRIGGFDTNGTLAFDARHIAVLARFKRGDLYDSRTIDDLRKALIATGLLSTVSVEPVRTGTDAGDGTEYVTMLVRQQAGPPRTLAATAGYNTGQGIRAEGSWTHRNFWRPEGALIINGIGGSQEQGLGATFRRSNAGRRDRTVQLGLDALHSNYAAFEAFTGRLAGRISYDSTPLWQKKFPYAFGFELIGTSEDDYSFTLGQRQRRTYYIAGLNGQIGFDRSDSLLNPTRGQRVTLTLQPEGSLSGGFSPYLRAQLDASAYYPLGDALVLAGRVRVGSIINVAREDLAPSRRFYGGGGGSVRGFGYQQLGPKDPDTRPIGGRSLTEAAGELRYRFGNFGVVGFVDAGQVYESSSPGLSNIRLGAGIGARYYTNFGPLRLDIATPINRQPGESRINIYVSIGQAF